MKMLSSLVKEHNKQTTKKEIQETKWKEACATASDLTQALVDHLNVGVAQAYLNQKKLDIESKTLHSSSSTFAKQTQQWLCLVESFNNGLKGLGDVENWTRTIEEEMKLISAALETVYKTM
ncbi:biogenesis of lysosome-related organelles complex 1 subunit 1 [Cylas formicarius]|uniref:biogenesis of lysosome-related organelles complex 1 subunit 1 n=1 Tax=Cylas formicarius TaxID=197179 RepID=UPI002958C272|nr:biogenesis of lysosome-related organelles complex 1 subunit 1 [Cylas formicarius]